MIPRKENQLGLVSQLRVKRLQQELADAHKKLEEYEELIASLSATLENIQSLACHKCRATFEESVQAADPAAIPTQCNWSSTAALRQPQSDIPNEFGKSHHGHRMMSVDHRAHAHSHSHNNIMVTNLVDDGPAQRRTATAFPSSEMISISSPTGYSTVFNLERPHPMPFQAPSISSRPSSSASRYDGQQSISFQEPSISSRPSSSASKYDGQQPISFQAPSISSRPSSSASKHDRQQPISFQVPSISSRPSSSASKYDGQRPTNLYASTISSASNRYNDPPDGWSISFDKGTKPSIDVKLVDALVFKEMVSCVKFSPDGNYLAVGLDSGETYIHSMKLGQKTCTLAELSTTNQPPKRDRVWSMSFSPDSKYLAIGSYSAIIRIWDIAKKHVRNVFRHNGGVSGVDFSPNGRFVVSAAHDGTVRTWFMRDGSCRVFLDTVSYYSLRLTPDGRYVTAMDYNGVLTIWNYRTGQKVGWKCHTSPATIAIMPNGTGLVTGSWDKTIKYWNLSSAGETQEGTVELNEITSFKGHTRIVRGVTISADGQRVISISDDLKIRIWDSRTAQRQCTMKGHEEDIWWVDASPVGTYFATGGNDHRLAIWRCNPV